ncbi:MAG: HAMP domain-containing protein [Thermoanaerobaculia bacterium]|nr:HAMP domain-containing protein [Thermoanaerobaculia bacterium]
MLRSRFLWKLFGLYAFLILTTVTIVASLVGRRIERDALEQTRQNLLSEALLLREVVRDREVGSGGEPLQARLRALGHDVGARFTVLAGGWDGWSPTRIQDPALMETHAQRPEILALAAQPVGTATRFSATLSEERMYLALMIEPGHPERGYVRSSLSLDAVRARRASLRGIVAVGTAIGAVIALALSFMFARQTTRPLIALTEAADKLAAGKSEIDLDIRSDDEIGRLARALSTMSRQLRWQLTTITTDRNQLTAILASMAEGLVAVDRNERIVHMNGVAGDLLGLRAEEVRGRPIWEATRIPEISERSRRPWKKHRRSSARSGCPGRAIASSICAARPCGNGMVPWPERCW